MVGLIRWRIKEDQNGVTDKFVDRAFLFERAIDHHLQKLVQPIQYRFRLVVFGETCKAANVCEHNGDFAAFATDGDFLECSLGNQIRNHRARHVAAKQIRHAISPTNLVAVSDKPRQCAGQRDH